MKSRLFPPGRVALVVNSLLFTPPAPCQTKKSIDFIRHVMDWDWYYRHSEANAVIASQISEKVQANALIEGAGLALSELSQLPEAQVPIPPEVGYRIAAFAAQAAADNRRREAMHFLVAAGPLGAAGTDGADESNTGGD